MNKQMILSTALTAAIAICGLVPGAAHATDQKTIGVTGCRPLTGPDATGLIFDSRGVVNSTNVNKRVICSLGKDAEDVYDATNYAILVAWAHAGAIDGSLSCTYYLGSVGYGNLITFTGSISLSAGGADAASVTANNYPTFWAVGPQIAVCTLSSKMTLSHFYIYEAGVTNS